MRVRNIPRIRSRSKSCARRQQVRQIRGLRPVKMQTYIRMLAGPPTRPFSATFRLRTLSGRTYGRTKIIANKIFPQTYLPFGNPIERLVSDSSCTQTVHPQETLASQIPDSDQGT